MIRRAYPDSAYDPAPPPSWWAATVPQAGLRRTPLERDLEVEVAIVGAGYTGLSAALALAERGVEAAVFDAAYPGWGASGRNGGFCVVGGSALDYHAQVSKFGFEATRAFAEAQIASTRHVADLLGRFGIDADRHSDGEWALAHSDRTWARAEAAASLERRLGLPVNSFTQDELDERGMRGPAFHGGHQMAVGFALNPLKYAHGLAVAAEAAGAAIYTHSPVHSTAPTPGGFRLRAGGFGVRARKLIVGANGYGGDDWLPGLDDCVMPVMSSIAVTRQLSDEELNGPGWSSDQAAYDTRSSVHYFRLLPDRRFLFGARGGSSMNPVLLRRLKERIRRDFNVMFPHWRHVEMSHEWNGLLALSRDRNLYVGRLGEWADAWTALAYHGNGVAMASYSGKLLAELAVGDRTEASLPAIMRGPLRRFPFPRLRMAYVKAYYAGWDIAEALRG